MKKYCWRFGNIRITKRELLVSATIVAVMMLLGFVISGKIETYQIDKKAEYYKAAQIIDTEMFQYGMDTSLGNAFVYGQLEPVDVVTFPEIGGAYIYVEKVEEHYNMHTMTVTHTDSNGKKQTRTEIYWSWDYAGSEELSAKTVRFCGVEMDFPKIRLPSSRYIDTLNESSRIRFQYYGCEGPYEGTIYTDLRDGTISNSSFFYNGKEIGQVIEDLTNDVSLIFFWILWIIAIIGSVFGFCYLENEWLEDKKPRF